jgi:site-specific DNA-methyltransferase (adenine-specific)/site-specific DNA-methyltransferase (cytosine-N4-specific)
LSVWDRPTKSHEYICIFSKSQRYYYNRQAILEPAKFSGKTKNRRPVWSIPITPSPEAHFATPQELVKLFLQTGSGVGDVIIDPFCEFGSVGKVCRQSDGGFVDVELNAVYAHRQKIKL